MLQPVILSGGKGSRLWPLSRDIHPKQYLRVRGDKTLFQQALERARSIPGAEAPMVLCNNEHRFLVAEQLRELDAQASIILEPAARNTAPAVTLAALLRREQDPLLLVLPADHLIMHPAALVEAVQQAEQLARNGRLVTFGVVPEHAETGYGYLEAGSELENGFSVKRFIEKPDQKTAASYLERGGYYWNSGMVLMRASTFLDEVEQHAPDILEACRPVAEATYRDLDFIRLDEQAFERCPSRSLDYAVMEKTARCAMVRLDAGWSDLGSWSSLHQAGEKDDQGNVIIGDVLAFESSDCYLHSEKRLLAAVGLRDIIAVETPDAILVGHRSQAQHVRAVVERLKHEKRPEAVRHSKEYRPWGSFECIARENRFQVKRIMVKPGQTLSLQMHHHRAEHWIVVNGTARVTVGEAVTLLSEDQSTYIPIGQKHRLENPGKIPLELIEIQTGAYLGEDDIVRLEDVYGREIQN
ncbi:MAG: mannose-1-phosphate guanylyltransferase/mannose-6-phosphate isomerase [Desulfovibrio sp.]|jgi:mannose-1-phosphate guanylyltransferase/mannose-6-phosphate isomerase|nr:mannose-1-phosphate guanylyltransferase/mannose-6-phosphate isomerase [Desulfovibrio sp.]